jgi:hypothetical protein
MVKKSDGGFRKTWRFGLMMRARHILVKEALTPLLEGRIWRQMCFDGGRLVGLNDVRNALRDSRYSHFAHVDIASFFDSVDLRGATHLLPLHRRVMENTLCVRPQDWSATLKECGRSLSTDGDIDVRRPLALLQGAASSPLIAYYLLEFAFEGMQDVFPYADNMLILGSSREEVDAKVSCYRSALLGHPVGPLHLRAVEFGEVTRSDGLDYLGVNFATTDTGYAAYRPVTATVSASTLSSFLERLDARLMRHTAGNVLMLEMACKSLRGFMLAMPTDDRRHG